jgi:hypothetical protein
MGEEVKTLKNHSHFKERFIPLCGMHLNMIHPVFAVKEELIFDINLSVIDLFEPVEGTEISRLACPRGAYDADHFLLLNRKGHVP